MEFNDDVHSRFLTIEEFGNGRTPSRSVACNGLHACLNVTADHVQENLLKSWNFLCFEKFYLIANISECFFLVWVFFCKQNLRAYTGMIAKGIA
jgi:hypothetical protein